MHIPKGRSGIEKNQTEASSKPSMIVQGTYGMHAAVGCFCIEKSKRFAITAVGQILNTVAPCSASGAGSGKMWATNGLGSPILLASPVATHRTSLRLALLTACGFPWQTFHVPGIFSVRSSVGFWFHSYSFTHCQLRGTVHDLEGLPLKYEWKSL